MEITQIAFFIAVMFAVLALILLLAWVAKRYLGGGGAARGKGSPLRRRERRLALVEAASISPRHKLVLVRRDNVEHLLLLGGGNELVVESRIASQSDDTGARLRDREPGFGPSGNSGDTMGSAAPGPELSRSPAPTLQPTTYGAATAGTYEPSLYRRDDVDDQSGDRSEPPDFSQRENEPDYFASNRDDTGSDDERPSYLDNEDEPEPVPVSTYEKYRPSYGTGQAADDRPDTDNAAPGTADDGNDLKQSRILSRFLRKDNAE